MPKKDLIEYLPDDTVLLPQAGSHLNIAHPLWQRISKKKQDIYGSADSNRREIFSELIRNSDGVVREYFEAFVEELRLNLDKSLTDGTTSLSKTYYAFWMAHNKHK